VYTGFKPMPAGTKKLLGFKYENFTVSDDNQEVDWRKELSLLLRTKANAVHIYIYNLFGTVIHNLIRSMILTLNN
jgi:hypothetical protein